MKNSTDLSHLTPEMRERLNRMVGMMPGVAVGSVRAGDRPGKWIVDLVMGRQHAGTIVFDPPRQRR